MAFLFSSPTKEDQDGVNFVHRTLPGRLDADPHMQCVISEENMTRSPMMQLKNTHVAVPTHCKPLQDGKARLLQFISIATKQAFFPLQHIWVLTAHISTPCWQACEAVISTLKVFIISTHIGFPPRFSAFPDLSCHSTVVSQYVYHSLVWSLCAGAHHGDR